MTTPFVIVFKPDFHRNKPVYRMVFQSNRMASDRPSFVNIHCCFNSGSRKKTESKNLQCCMATQLKPVIYPDSTVSIIKCFL